MVAFSLNSIGLLPPQLKAVERKAKLAGKTAPEYVRLLIEQDLLADKPFDEILRPVRQDFRKNGITKNQLDAMVQRARRRSRVRPENRKTR